MKSIFMWEAWTFSYQLKCMKRFIIFILALYSCSVLFAEHLTSEQALERVLKVYNANIAKSSKHQVRFLRPASVELIDGENNLNTDSVFYVYGINDGGFLIASADSRAEALLGYTKNGEYSDALSNPAFCSWLEQCKSALKWMDRHPSYAWDGNEKGAPVSAILPLLGEIKWNQNAPYNNKCPQKSISDGSSTMQKHAPAGCVAIAMAQVMKYYEWPLNAVGGVHTNANEPTQTVNYNRSSYDWSKISNWYSGSETDEKADAVATLIKEIGCALDMTYGYSSSGAPAEQIPYVFANYFKYDKGVQCHKRIMYDTNGWNKLIVDELAASRPVIMCAHTSTGIAHSFVVDGCDAQGLYHVNWGWGGMSDGYFNINFMQPSQQGIGGGAGGYNVLQEVVTGIKKDEQGTSTAEPELEIEEQTTYNSDTQTFSCKFVNRGLGGFIGEVGFVLLSNDGATQLHKQSINCDENPIPYRGTYTATYRIPESIIVKQNYIVVPFYQETASAPQMIPTTPKTAEIYLTSYLDDTGNIKWGYYYEQALPNLTAEVDVERNFVGFTPKFKLKITNSSKTNMEYNDCIYVSVMRQQGFGVNLYCSGEAQLFLRPGETETVELDCVLPGDGYTYADLKAGSYDYEVYFVRGSQFPVINSGSIKMEKMEPSNITYSDFSVDKNQIERGDELTACFNVRNTGGYDQRMLTFGIFKDEDLVTYLGGLNYDIPQNQTINITLKGIVDLEAGKYVYVFFDGSKQLTNPMELTVLSPGAGIDNVEIDNMNHSIIFNLNGQRVTETEKGRIYIINGKKVIL